MCSEEDTFLLRQGSLSLVKMSLKLDSPYFSWYFKAKRKSKINQQRRMRNEELNIQLSDIFCLFFSSMNIGNNNKKKTVEGSPALWLSAKIHFIKNLKVTLLICSHHAIKSLLQKGISIICHFRTNGSYGTHRVNLGAQRTFIRMHLPHPQGKPGTQGFHQY